MLVFFGKKGFEKNLGTITNVNCPACTRPSTMEIIRQRIFFTIYFLPLFPVGTKYYVRCTTCGTIMNLNKLKGKEFDKVGQTYIETTDLY